MCMSSPKIPEATKPVEYQEAKTPAQTARKPGQMATTGATSGMAGGSLLTGPSGAAVQAGNVAGANTLLGA